MIYILFIVAFGDFFLLYKRMNRSPSVIRIHLLFLSFILLFFFLINATGIYMARHNIYSNTLHKYMLFARTAWGVNTFSNLSRENLIRIIEYFIMLVPYIGHAFVLAYTNNWRRKYLLFLGLAYVFLILFYDPAIQIWIYKQLYPSIMSYTQYHRFYEVFGSICWVLNTILLVANIVILIRYLLRLPRFPELIASTLLITSICISISLAYLWAFYWAPMALLKYSQVAGLTTYLTIPFHQNSSPDTVFIVLHSILLLFLILGFIVEWLVHNHIRKNERAISTTKKTLNDISCVVMHYFKNEILAIEGEIAIAQESGEHTASLDALANIKNICSNIWNRLEEARRSSQSYKLHISRVSLHDLMGELLLEQAQLLSNILVHMNIPDDIYVQVDRNSFKSVIINLISNANEAMSDLPEERRVLDIRASFTQNWVQLSIRDHGNGLKLTKANMAFNPFVTTKPSRTNWGLGLTLCQRLIAAHKGRISISNNIGKGVTVTLLLPWIAMGINK